MHVVSDIDALYEETEIDREVEALPRAIACLREGVKNPGHHDPRLGELQSFKYIAAGVCLRELELMRRRLGQRPVLPRV